MKLYNNSGMTADRYNMSARDRDQQKELHSSGTHEEKATKTETEDIMSRMMREKEQRAMDLYYELCEVEPEEESLEQKIRRQRKELSDNTIR